MITMAGSLAQLREGLTVTCSSHIKQLLVLVPPTSYIINVQKLPVGVAVYVGFAWAVLPAAVSAKSGQSFLDNFVTLTIVHLCTYGMLDNRAYGSLRL